MNKVRTSGSAKTRVAQAPCVPVAAATASGPSSDSKRPTAFRSETGRSRELRGRRGRSISASALPHLMLLLVWAGGVGCHLDRHPQAGDAELVIGTPPLEALPEGAAEGVEEAPGPNPGGADGNPGGAGVPIGGVEALSGGAQGPTAAPAGSTCDRDGDCESGHCASNLCCAEGLCCRQAADCIAADATASQCHTPQACQGGTASFECVDFQCLALNETSEDDRPCTSETEASACGPYPAVFCNGEQEQEAPSCPTQCEQDDECDEEAHCDGARCQLDGTDGALCDRDSQCLSGHCDSGICCAGGECCTETDDCSAAAARCDAPVTCQGSRPRMLCENFTCIEGGREADDSACSSQVVALECGAYANRVCSGGREQEPPACPASCLTREDCDDDHFCNALFECALQHELGATCLVHAQCASGECGSNGRCCDDGLCCESDRDCAAFEGSPVCTDRDLCMGERVQGYCGGDGHCARRTVPDATGCAGARLQDCRPYAPGYITCGPDGKPTLPRCPDSCTTNNDCIRPYVCRSGTCQLECQTDGECGSGQACRDYQCRAL